MDTLTEAEIAELQRFALELSKPNMPVRVEYVHPHVVVKFKKGASSGLADDVHGLLLAQYDNLEQLKAAIKSHAGVT